MFTYRQLILTVVLVLVLAVGIWMGRQMHQFPQIVPTVQAQGIVVNQERPDQITAAAFTVSDDGAVLHWWRVQSNGLGEVNIFDSRTGSVRQREFRR